MMRITHVLAAVAVSCATLAVSSSAWACGPRAHAKVNVSHVTMDPVVIQANVSRRPARWVVIRHDRQQHRLALLPLRARQPLMLRMHAAAR